MSSFYLIVKRGETSLRLGYSAQQVHIIIIIIMWLRVMYSDLKWGLSTLQQLLVPHNKFIMIVVNTRLDVCRFCGSVFT